MPPHESREPLAQRAQWLRQTLFEMAVRSGRGHIAAAFSAVDILVTLFYGGVLRYTAGRPHDPDRDALIVSEGDAGMALYPILVDVGWVPQAELGWFAQADGVFRLYPDPSIPGIDAVGGAPGHGLGIAAGLAWTAKQDGRSRRAFVVLGDDECHIGSVWEAAAFAAHHRLDNLIAVVDRNRRCRLGDTEQLLAVGALEDKWRSFGWDTVRVDGHAHDALCTGFARIGRTGARPLAIVADTVQGKGVSFMEHRADWRDRMPTPAEASEARAELARGIAR
jgi:transketolase